MKRLAIAAALCLTLTGCWHLTRDQGDAAKNAGGLIGMLLGIPRPVGEGITGAILAPFLYAAGHKRGRRRERACHVPKATPT